MDLRMEVLSLQHLVQISVVQEQQVPFQVLDLGLGSVWVLMEEQMLLVVQRDQLYQ